VRKNPFLIVFSISLYLTGRYALVWKLEPALFFFYVTSWWSYIIFLDAVLRRRSGNHIFLNDEATLSGIFGETNPRRVYIYRRAVQEQ